MQQHSTTYSASSFLAMADSINIVVNATAKSGVWVHFGFPGSPDDTILTKKVLQLYFVACSSSYMRLYTNITIVHYIAIFHVAICNITNRHIASALVCMYVLYFSVLYRIAGKFHSRIFHDFALIQTFRGFNFAICVLIVCICALILMIS